MDKTILKRILMFFAVSCFMLSCEKGVPFPTPTEAGLNTFGVKIDGVKWLPKQGISLTGGAPKLKGGYNAREQIVAIEARKGVSDEVIVLTLVGVKGVGVYELNIDSTKTTISQFRGKYVDDNYLPFSTTTNVVNITRLDTIEKVISGVFSARLIGQRDKAVKNLSEGIFDIHYE